MAAISSTTPLDDETFHELWHFPPMFTIQRQVEVRERQLGVWQEIILNFHKRRKEYVLEVANAPFFSNKDINRALNKDERNAVLDHMIETGHGEWLDEPVRSQFLVMWDTAQQISNEIYSWAQETSKIGEIFTVYDIHSEDDSVGRGFHRAHPRAIVKALARLQDNGKAKIYRDEGKSVDEWGVKFLP